MAETLTVSSGIFAPLRAVPWNATFEWLPTSMAAAERINSYHDGGKAFVDRTRWVLDVMGDGLVDRRHWRRAHGIIFGGHPAYKPGHWRRSAVRVGPYVAPPAASVPRLMARLENWNHAGERDYGMNWRKDLNVLLAWYWDFETVHPFQDGNGRVGGVVVAALSHQVRPDLGWLAACQ
mgnify:CR=1 FL=1